jgi:hydroxymethylglutaryl-CoA lyase
MSVPPGTGFPAEIEFVEVGPRDGLQNERRLIPTEAKVELINRLLRGGIRRIEIASFVHPGRVPQMADAEGVCAALAERTDICRIGLALNLRGAERALATGAIDEIGAVTAASDGFARANQGQSSAEATATAGEVLRLAVAAGRSAQVTISTAFGCPFDGSVDPQAVVRMAIRLAEWAPREIALADTIGIARPAEVAHLVHEVRRAIAPIPVRVHFHDTRGTALANVRAAIAAGASVVDGSVGGLGGCPFAPGAPGNVASEQVITMLNDERVATGVSGAALDAVGRWVRDRIGSIECLDRA